MSDRQLLQTETLDSLSQGAWLAIGLVVGFSGGVLCTLLTAWIWRRFKPWPQPQPTAQFAPMQQAINHNTHSTPFKPNSEAQTTASMQGSHTMPESKPGTQSSQHLLHAQGQAKPSTANSTPTDALWAPIQLSPGAHVHGDSVHIDVQALGEVQDEGQSCVQTEVQGEVQSGAQSKVQCEVQPGPTHLCVDPLTQVPLDLPPAPPLGGIAELEYRDADLDEDWNVLLGEVDELLLATGQRCMNPKERGLAVQKLIAATGSRGEAAAEFALKKARDEVLRARARDAQHL